MSRFSSLGAATRPGLGGSTSAKKDDTGLEAWNAWQATQKLGEEARKVAAEGFKVDDDEDDGKEAWEEKEDDAHCRPFERDDDWLPSVKGHWDLDTTGLKLIGAAFPFALRTVLPKLLYQGPLCLVTCSVPAEFNGEVSSCLCVQASVTSLRRFASHFSYAPLLLL
jgi:hypothetical protein